MIILDSTTKKLQAYTTATPSAVLTYYISYVDISSLALSAVAAVHGTFNQTRTDILAAPGSGVQRQVKAISIYNASNATQEVNIVLDVSGADTFLFKLNVNAGCILSYQNGQWVETTKAVIGTSLITLSETSDPSPPGNSTLYLYSKKVANRILPKFIGPSGIDSALQPFMARNKIGYWCPPGNAATVPGVFGFTAYTAIGTATLRNVANNNMFVRMRRLAFVSAAGAGSLGGARVAVAQITIGTGSGLGGFFKLIRFGISDAAEVAGARMFVGISSGTGAPTNVEPSTLLNSIGVGHRAADTNLWIFYGGSTAQAPINLGANFPITPGNVDVYELALFAPPNVDNIVYYEVTRLNTGHVATGTLTGTAGVALPANTTLLTYTQAWRCNNATALAVGLDIMSDYIETDT